MRKIFVFLGNICKYLFFFIFFLFVSVILVQKISHNKITLGGYSIFQVVTQSMTPKYQVGDLLLAMKVDVSKLKVGDDIVYVGSKGVFQNKMVTHQIVRIDKGKKIKIHTKGLNNMIEDPVVDESQVYGKIIAKLTILSILNRLFDSSYFFCFVIILFCYIQLSCFR